MTRLVLVLSFLWIGVAVGADLPDADLTPGVPSDLTQEQICAKSFTTKDERSVSAATKKAVFAAYHLKNHVGACNCPARSKKTGKVRNEGCEIDHLISLELSGKNDPANLWVQPYCGLWNAHKKDALENRLHKLVCAGELDLATAQQEISTDWIASYKARMK